MTLSPSRGRIGLLGGRVRIGCNGNLNLGPAFQTDGFAFAVLQNIVDSNFLILLLGTVHMDLCLFRSVRAHRLDVFSTLPGKVTAGLSIADSSLGNVSVKAYPSFIIGLLTREPSPGQSLHTLHRFADHFKTTLPS
jgi:hypothetical protein